MKKYLYNHVKMYNFEKTWDFRYLSDEDIYNVGDYVWVQVDDEELPAIITDKIWYGEDKVPWPLDKMKKVIRKSSYEEYLKYNEFSILRYVLSRLDKDSKLPDNFSLDKYRKGKLKFVDGAMDGISVFHSEFSADEELIKDIFDKIRNKDENYIKVVKEFDKLLKDRILIPNVVDIRKYAFEHKENDLSSEYIYRLSYIMIFRGKNPETVKLGIILMSTFEIGKDKDLYYIFNKLALCEEFTEYISSYIFPFYKDSEKIKFKIAKKVKGWGRVFIIYDMKFDTNEKKKWLLKKGFLNNIDEGYTATYILSQLDTKKLILKGSKDDFIYISEIINIAILNEPGAPIDSLKNYREIFDAYLSVKDSHKGDYKYYATVKNIYQFEGKKYREALDILESEDCYNTVKKCITKGDRHSAYNVIDICQLSKKHDYKNVILERFNKHIVKNGFCLYYLLRNSETKDQIIKRLNDGLDLVAGFEVDNISYIDFLRELKNYPLVGLPYVREAFRMHLNDVKDQAIWLINYWNDEGAKIPKEFKKYIRTYENKG